MISVVSLNLLVSIFFLFNIFKNKVREELIFLIIPYSVVLDIFVNHFSEEGALLFTINRIIITATIIILVLKNKIYLNFFSMFLFLSYMFLLVFLREPFYGDFIFSLDITVKIFISVLLVYVSYNKVENKNLEVLSNYIIYSLFIFLLYLVIANIFGLGNNMYLKEDDDYKEIGVITTGALKGNGLYTLAYLVALYPLVIKYNYKFNKLLVNILFALGVIAVVLPYRRTAIIIVVICFLFYIIKLNKLEKQFYKNLILLLVLGLFLLPVFLPKIYNIIELRRSKGVEIDSYETFEKEGRTNEIEYLVSKYLASENLGLIFFGESFDSRGAYPFANSLRPLHSDISFLIFSSGFLGIGLFLYFQFGLWQKYQTLKRLSSNFTLKITFVAFFVSNIFLLYPGRITSISHKSIVYIVLGSSLSCLKKENKISTTKMTVIS